MAAVGMKLRTSLYRFAILAPIHFQFARDDAGVKFLRGEKFAVVLHAIGRRFTPREYSAEYARALKNYELGINR